MRKFFVKLACFFTLIILAQWVMVKVDKSVYWSQIPVEVQEFKNNVALGKDIFFFGDSVSFFSGKEGDPRTIPDFLSMTIDKEVTKVTHSAYHAEIFRDYIKQLPRQAADCPIIVVEVNPRSFSEAWRKRPEYQYEREKFFLENYNNPWFRLLWKPLAVFKFFNLETYTAKEFRETPVVRNGKKVGTMQDFYDLEKSGNIDHLRKVAFNYDYLYDLNYNDRKLLALAEIARIRKDCPRETLFYVTPVDYQTGEYYWTDQFTKKLKSNINVIDTVLKKNGASLIDWSTIYTSDQFMWRETNYPDEHLRSKARENIAHRIAEYLLQGKSL